MRKLLTILLLLISVLTYSQTNATFKNLDVRETSKLRGLIYPFGASAKSPLSTSDEVLMVELPSFKLVRVDFAEFADSITSYITIPTYTVSNRNTLGWYSRQIGYDFQFRGVKSTDGYIDFLDSNTYIGLTLDTANLFDDMPIPPQYWTFVDAATDTLKNNVATVGVVAIKGNLELETTNAAATNGVVKQNGVNLIHTYHEKGDNNLFIGQGAGNFTLDSSFNVGIGKRAGTSLTTGYSNTIIGADAGRVMQSAYGNTAIGQGAMETSTTSGCVAIGDGAGDAMSAFGNIAMGIGAGGNIGGVYNIAIGYNAFAGTNGDARYNVAIGYNGALALSTGDENVFIGAYSAANNTTGGTNTAIGNYALNQNVGNSQSVAIGHSALKYTDSRVSGRTTYNTAVGTEAMRGSTTASNNTGQYNSAVGHRALYAMTSASFNTVYGYNAGGGITTGDSNILIGASAGSQLTTESDRLYIDNTNTTTPLIYGNFRTDALTFNGDITYGDTFWDDLSTPATAAKIGATSQPAFDYDTLALLWDNTPVDTSTQLIVLNYQLPHRWKAGSDLYLHVHYLQHSATDTCEFFKATYKWTDMGETRAGAYTTTKTDNQTVYAYTSNTLHQLASFPLISGAGHTESSILQIILYCYSDANLYSLDSDIHFEIDKPGSDAQFP